MTQGTPRVEGRASRPLWRALLRPAWGLLHPARWEANWLVAKARGLWARLRARGLRLRRRAASSVLHPRYRCMALGRFRLYVDVKCPLIGAPLAAGAPYEAHLTKALVAALRPGDTFLDLGANMGYFTMLAASLVGPGGRVIAFEPRQDNVALIHLSARENGFAHVEVHPFAVAEREQVFKYYPSAETSLSYVVEATRPCLSSGHDVRAVALDEALAALPRLDVVKIDIDGNEPRALAGMRGLLLRHRPVLFFEFAPECIRQVSGAAPEALLDEISALGYEMRTMGPDGRLSPPRSAREVIAATDKSGIHIDLAAHPAGAGPSARAA